MSFWVRWGMAGVLTAGTALASAEGPPAAAPLRILCSTFPMGLFTRNVLGAEADDRAELLLPANLGCPHDYMLTPQDARRLVVAHVCVVNGMGLDDFLVEALASTGSQAIVVDTSRAIEQPLPLYEAGQAHGHKHGDTFNPHAFASPRQAARIVRYIADELAKLRPARQDAYRRNALRYADELEALDESFMTAARGFPTRAMVTQHAVFDYLARDVGLDIAAVIETTPGQAPAAAETLRLVQVIRARGVAAVLVEPQYPQDVGQMVARETKVPLAVLDPVASGPDDAPLDHYQRVMRTNLETLQKVLGKAAP